MFKSSRRNCIWTGLLIIIILVLKKKVIGNQIYYSIMTNRSQYDADKISYRIHSLFSYKIFPTVCYIAVL